MRALPINAFISIDVYYLVVNAARADSGGFGSRWIPNFYYAKPAFYQKLHFLVEKFNSILCYEGWK